MPRRLAWVVLPALAAAATLAGPARAARMTHDATPLAVAAADRPLTWDDTAHAPVPGRTAADAELAVLSVAMAVQPGANGRRHAAPATIAAKTIARLPEPATWVMLILGFGGVGAAVRRQLRRSDERFNEHIRRIAASSDELA